MQSGIRMDRETRGVIKERRERERGWHELRVRKVWRVGAMRDEGQVKFGLGFRFGFGFGHCTKLDGLWQAGALV